MYYFCNLKQTNLKKYLNSYTGINKLEIDQELNIAYFL